MSMQPFPEKCPASDLMTDDRMTEGLARLTFMTQSESVALITGDEGAGKSSLIKRFMFSLDKKSFSPVYFHLTTLKPIAFLKMLVAAMNEIPTPGKEQAFTQILSKIREKDFITILIIDEAHLLPSQSLVDLRLLISCATEDSDRLKLVLVGHPDLKKEIKRSCHAALRQRLKILYHLPPLSKAQSALYIDFHLARVGASTKLFDADVKSAIHETARGIPRLINNIATACLLAAYSKNLKRISSEIFSHALDDIQPLL
jgi:general secretion pathway protein A